MNLDIENWKQFKLGKVLSIKNGSGITKAEISQYEGDFPAVQSGESNNGILGYIDLDYCKEMGYAYSLTRCLTVARSGSAGFVALQPTGCVVGDSAKILHVRDTKKENIYVRYWGSERIEQYLRITVGTREEMEALFTFLKSYMR